MQQRYSYAAPSTVSAGAGVGLSTSGGPSAHPFFFSGFLTRPRLSAGLLLSVSKVAGSRFYVPSAMIDAVIRAADPVVTSDGHQLRFESFSVCTGVYSRADFSRDALDGGFVESGTTNVDFNPPMRNALARLRDRDAVHLSVGVDDVTLSTMRETLVERRVPLPARWLRGFAEVQLAQVAMTPRFELGLVATRRFLSTLARQPKNGDWWVSPTADGIALADRPGSGCVRIGGLERMRLLTRHASHATALRVWSTDEEPSCGSAWELEVPASRLTLVLSPEPGRGFSGEGNVLRDVVDTATVEAAEVLRPLVQRAHDVDTSELATQTAIDRTTVGRALNVLASSGVVGYDVGSARFFARQLPFDADAMALLHPRLRGAQALGSAAIVILECQSDVKVTAVAGRSATYIVRSTATETTCTCPWYEKHRGTRGPCKHVLAVELFDADTDAEAPV